MKLALVVGNIQGKSARRRWTGWRQIQDHINDLDRRVAALDGMVEQYMAEYAQALNAIDEIPGIARCSVQVTLAEIGLDISDVRIWAEQRNNGRYNLYISCA